MSLSKARVVLVRPHIAENLGATARVMRNMGLSDLVLVAPEADPTARQARRLSSHGEAILDQVRHGGTIRVKDLAPRRDYVFIDDLVAALIATIENPAGYRVFNIGLGVSYSVREIIDIVQTVAGTGLPVVSDEEARPDEIPDVRADIARARKALGWTPRYMFAEGIERLLQDAAAAPSK